MNIYFADFYCINGPHYLTLVVTSKESESDAEKESESDADKSKKESKNDADKYGISYILLMSRNSGFAEIASSNWTHSAIHS